MYLRIVLRSTASRQPSPPNDGTSPGRSAGVIRRESYVLAWMAELGNAIESALGISFALHESSYRGGEYLRAALRDGEELVLQLDNFQLGDEMEVAEPGYPGYPLVFWVAWTDPADEMRAKLANVDGLVFSGAKSDSHLRS
jgi:hypothetical protein